MGLLFDATLCVGCGSCYDACKKENNLPATNKDFLKDHLSNNTYTVVEEYGDTYARKMCMHCAEPTCASVCPVGAFEKTELDLCFMMLINALAADIVCRHVRTAFRDMNGVALHHE